MSENASLLRHVEGRTDPDALLEGFLAWTAEQKLTLYPAQEEAILELFGGRHVILATPTGSGKSLVATALHAKSLAEGRRTFYTAPIKALVGEKFFALCRDLGAENVGLMTGDASVNRDAKVICCTAEVLSNLALRQGDEADIGSVVVDELHYYGDRDRGVAWQIPLLLLRNAQFLLMSGTLGDVTFFERDLLERTGREVTTVRTSERPVPLEYEYRETPLHETLADLIQKGRAPVYVVHFTQRGAAEHAQDLMSVELLDKARKHALKEALVGVRWDSPYGKELARFVKHGVGVHHAGLLPKYRLLVEKLAQKGLLAVICGTDTLGVGVNVPIRSVLFTQLCKYDGQKTAILSVRDFHQIAGRAGRKGFDDRGWVVAQAPEHVIENQAARDKAQNDPKKVRKLVARKPPEKGYAHWDEQTFRRLVEGVPERLESRFRVSHGMILSVLQGAERRGVSGCRALEDLLRTTHDSRPRKFQHARHALALLRSLRDAGIVTIDSQGLHVHETLQDDFSLHQALSLFVVETLPTLDPADPLHAADVLTLVESILENPDAVLMKQRDRLKEQKLQEMKAQGMEYDERMAELEKIDIPRPRLDFLEHAFDEFSARHRWVPREGLRPKSVARDMWERSATFAEYVKEYNLQRSEGVLLRYLSDAYKTLRETVPGVDKTDEVDDLVEWLRAVVKMVDSSLIDEWESLLAPSADTPAAARAEKAPDDLTTDPRAFTAMIRNAVFAFVRALSRREFVDAAARVVAPDGAPPWTPEDLEERVAEFELEHGKIRTDPAARAPVQVRIARSDEAWHVEQTLLDDEGVGDFFVDLRVDLDRAREAGEPVLELRGIVRQ